MNIARSLALAGLCLLGAQTVHAQTLPCGTTTTNGSGQTYTVAMTLICDTTLQDTAGGDIQFTARVDGGYQLTVITTGAASFGAAVGDTAALTGLTVNSGTLNTAALNIVGNLSLTTSGGGIAQNGAFKVTGSSQFDTSGAVTLTNTSNDFTSAVSLTGGVTQITASGALMLGAMAVDDLTAISSGALALGGGTINGLLSAQSGTSITANGTLSGLTGVSFNSSVVTGSGSFSGTGSINGLGSTGFMLTGITAGTVDSIGFSGFNAADTSTVTGASGFDASNMTSLDMAFANATSVTGSGAITNLGSTAFNLSGSQAGTAGGISFSGFDAAETATVNGASGFNDAGKTSSGMTFANATSVTGSGAITNVAGSFTDNAGTSAVSGISYTGFDSVSGTGGAITDISGSFNLGSMQSSATGLDYSGFAVTTLSGSGAGASITGSGLTHALDNTIANKGSSNGVGWSGFPNISDAAGTVNFGTGGNLTGNVAAQTLDYSAYGSAVAFELSSGSSTGIGGSSSGVAFITGSGNTDTIRGSNQSYALTGANAGESGDVSWISFEQIADDGTGAISSSGGQSYSLTGHNAGAVAVFLPGGFTGIGNLSDASGTVNFGTGGSLSGNVSAHTLDYGSYGAAVTVKLSGTGSTGIDGLASDIAAVTAASDLAVSGNADGALDLSTTGGGSSVSLGTTVVPGDLSIHSSGPILQTGGLSVLGTSTLDAGSGAITLTNADNSLQGKVDATGGTAALTSSSPLQAGAIAVTGNLVLDSPGVSTGASDSIEFGNGGSTGQVSGTYTQAGSLALHATATSSDQLAIGGGASLGGDLSVAFSAAPGAGQSFTLLSASGIAGTFGSVNVTGLAAGNVPQVVYNPTSVVLTVQGTTQTLSVSTPPNMALDAGPATVTASASSDLSVTLVSDTPTICAVVGTTSPFQIDLLGVGTCTLTAAQAGDANYAPVSQQVSFAVRAMLVPVPALNPWMLLLLASLIALVARVQMRRS